MSRKNGPALAGEVFLWFILLFSIVLIAAAVVTGNVLFAVGAIVISLGLIALHDRLQKQHAVLRNYPLIGRLRYFFESIRPEIRQYFFESDLDGKPFNRRQRSVIYQRAKGERETVAFGMQNNPNEIGYEWMAHSIYPVKIEDPDLRVWIGSRQCSKPYLSSILNIGAMSYGALSKTAIGALNQGARMGHFAHNTGEGGISPYHIRGGGDLIWQIGTGYFGCRNVDGTFNLEMFGKNASRAAVKMIELKLSQGAKPGHGGILPASKNTEEIAQIRGVKAGTAVHSPPAHSAFGNAEQMMIFIDQLRKASGGKPVGFKLCIGSKSEFKALCQAMINTEIIPDFITVDGAEGGTGAAPLEFTDHLGMPLHDALAFVSSTLKKYGLYKEIKILAAGKIVTGFDILKALSLGASACYSARGMMMALGCIQALKCDSGKCPVGVATQEKRLYKGIKVEDKRVRVANFHKNTLEATVEIMEACGIKSAEEVNPSNFYRKISALKTSSFEDIYFRKARIVKELKNQLN